MDALSAPVDIRELARGWRDGRIKQAVIRRSLALRQKRADLFSEGEYLALDVDGPAADHVIAFARRHEFTTVIAIATRLPTALLGRAHTSHDTVSIPPAGWGDTRIRLPVGAPPTLRNVLTQKELAAPDRAVALRLALADLPVAMLFAAPET